MSHYINGREAIDRQASNFRELLRKLLTVAVGFEKHLSEISLDKIDSIKNSDFRNIMCGYEIVIEDEPAGESDDLLTVTNRLIAWTFNLINLLDVHDDDPKNPGLGDNDPIEDRWEKYTRKMMHNCHTLTNKCSDVLSNLQMRIHVEKLRESLARAYHKYIELIS